MSEVNYVQYLTRLITLLTYSSNYIGILLVFSCVVYMIHSTKNNKGGG